MWKGRPVSRPFLKIMYTTPADMLDNLQRLPLDFVMQHAMEKTGDEAVNQQRLQLAQGLQSNDQYLPDYSFRSVFQYGKEPGPIKLYDTGAYYRGYKIDVREDIFILDSTDHKSEMLKKRYGPDIAGLGSEARSNYILTLRPVFINEVKTYLQ